MELNLDFSKGRYQIRSYEPGKLVVNDTIYNKSVIISLTTLKPWQPQTFAELTVNAFTDILALQPKIVILGTGEKQLFPSSLLLKPLIENNIGVEIMDTAAACRTFNVLTAEGREVVAALLLR